jgi:Rieske Fe-S protein
MNPLKITRRDFIMKAGQTALAAAVAAPMIGCDAKASSGKAPLPMQPIILDLTNPDYAALANAGGAVKIPHPKDKEKPIIVSRISENGVAAFSSKCTHMGCELPIPENSVITCPCHGAQFDASGKVTKGPAPKDLAAFSATLDGNTITIKENAG